MTDHLAEAVKRALKESVKNRMSEFEKEIYEHGTSRQFGRNGMTDISQAAKERAVELANGETTCHGQFKETLFNEYSAVSDIGTAFAKYIDKVSAVAEGVLNSETMDKARLQELILTDVDPLADALWGTSVSLKSNCERDAKELRNALAKAGYKIVKDEG